MPGGRPRKPPELKAQPASCKLPPALITAIKARATRDGTSATQVIVQACTAWLAAD